MMGERSASDVWTATMDDGRRWMVDERWMVGRGRWIGGHWS